MTRRPPNVVVGRLAIVPIDARWASPSESGLRLPSFQDRSTARNLFS